MTERDVVQSGFTAPIDREGEPNFPIKYYKVKSTKWTFEAKQTRKWIESKLSGKVLNAFAGMTELSHDGEIVRNDANPERPADYHMDANELGSVLEEGTFEAIIHDPPWSARQSEESYEGFQAGEVGDTMKMYDRLLKPGGKVIGVGFTASLMPKRLGYTRDEMAIFETIGRGDDYLGAVDRKKQHYLRSIRMTELYREHLEVGERFEHTRFTQLRRLDHRPEYRDVRVVPSESDDHAYLTAKVDCLKEPYDPETTDIVADTVTVPLCSCDDGWFRATKGFEDGDIAPTDFKKCKHYRAEFRAENAKSDDAQETFE
jgi:hypothetical protein